MSVFSLISRSVRLRNRKRHMVNPDLWRKSTKDTFLYLDPPTCRGVLAGLPHTTRTYRLPDRAPRKRRVLVCVMMCLVCL